ncbi:MAG: hemerythrin domain-containing protein [Kofleriaceae bacterium]|nr:hemerythrin domain-containing protein [Kofleriaceae bacterium]
MKSIKTPARALKELEAQHAALRGMMDRCLELADALDAGRCGPTQLLREVERLRMAFDSHNRFEETLLGPLLAAQLASTRAEPLEHAHIAEHRSLRARLASDVGSTASRDLREVIDQLRAHLDREEELLDTAQGLVADAPA